MNSFQNPFLLTQYNFDPPHKTQNSLIRSPVLQPYLIEGSLMVIMDSESVPHSRVCDSMSIEFTGRMLSSIRELISILPLSGDNHLLRVSLPPNWKEGFMEKLAPPDPAPAKHQKFDIFHINDLFPFSIFPHKPFQWTSIKNISVTYIYVQVFSPAASKLQT